MCAIIDVSPSADQSAKERNPPKANRTQRRRDVLTKTNPDQYVDFYATSELLLAIEARRAVTSPKGMPKSHPKWPVNENRPLAIVR